MIVAAGITNITLPQNVTPAPSNTPPLTITAPRSADTLAVHVQPSGTVPVTSLSPSLDDIHALPAGAISPASQTLSGAGLTEVFSAPSGVSIPGGAKWFTGAFSADTDGDGDVEPVDFVLIDASSNGTIDLVEISIDGPGFGGGGLLDGLVLAGNDEIVLANSLPFTAVVGAYEFRINFADTPSASLVPNTWYEGSEDIDIDGDGSADNSVTLLVSDNFSGDGLFDSLQISVDDAIYGENGAGPLNDQIADSDNDEVVTSLLTLPRAVSLGAYQYLIDFADNPYTATDLATVTANTWLTTSILIDADGDRAADDHVYFVLSDTDSDGVPDVSDMSIGDQVFGENGGGPLTDSIVGFDASNNTNDERFAPTSFPVVTLGTHRFLVGAVLNPTQTAADLQITARWYSGTFPADLDGNNTDETMAFVLSDPDSDGLFTVMDLDASGLAGGNGYQPSDVHALNNFTTFIGDREVEITFDLNPAVAGAVEIATINTGASFSTISDEEVIEVDFDLLFEGSTDQERRELASVSIPPEPRAPDPGSFIRTADGQLLVSGEVVVVLAQEVPDPEIAIKRLARANGAEIVGSISATRTYQLQVSAGSDEALAHVIRRIEAFRGIDGAAHHYLMEQLGSRVPDDPFFNRFEVEQQVNSSWGSDYIGLPAAWDITVGDRSIAVAVIDAHFDTGHSDLRPNVFKTIGRVTEAGGHGTHVTGTICAAGNNGNGFAGVAWECSLRTYDFGASSPVLAQDMMIEAVDDGARVVNMSLQWVDNNQCGKIGTTATVKKVQEINATLAPAIKYADRLKKDVLWVFASGNECRDTRYAAPASLVAQFPDNVVTVASIDPGGRLSSFSNRGDLITVAAPGGQVLSTKPRNCARGCVDTYAFDSGTSMAAPHVSGLAVLMMSANPGVTASRVKQCLVQTARKTIPLQSFKVVDAEAAVRCAAPDAAPRTTSPASGPLPQPQPTVPRPDATPPALPPAPAPGSQPASGQGGGVCGTPTNPC